MMLCGVVIAIVYRLMTLKEIMETIIDGMKLMLLACAILVLAWGLGRITTDMKLAEYLISIMGKSISFKYFPVVIFIIGAVISFSTGTSWGTMTILTPIALPITYKMTNDVSTAVMMAGVVFSGAIFGDHCSPISDTTILSSIFSGSDHLDHVNTQLPYALVVAFVTSLLFIAWGFWNINPLTLIIIGVVLLIGMIYFLNWLFRFLST